MTPPAALMDRCQALDVRLWVESGKLRFDAPRGALDDELRAALVEHKPGLVELLTGDTPPLAERPDPYRHLRGPYRTPWGTWAWSDPTAPELGAFIHAVPLDAEVGGTVRWRCQSPHCLHKTGWWLSTCGVVQCLNCKPPAFPWLVVAIGTEADAPDVLSDRTTTLIAHHDEDPER